MLPDRNGVISKKLPIISQPLIVILGPTACGKTALACALAGKTGREIISADSRQVYRKMDIGTGKDLSEYSVNGKPIPYHLIDIREPGYHYNIAEFEEDFLAAFNDINQRGNRPILCGGSGLYIEAAIRGNSLVGIPADHAFQNELDQRPSAEIEEMFRKIDPKIRTLLAADTRRRKIRAIEIDLFLQRNPEFKLADQTESRTAITSTLIGIDVARNLRRERISQRLKHRLDNGLIEEVQQLLTSGLTQKDLSYYGLEYKWVGEFLAGKIDRPALFSGLEIAIHQFAKRQMTWFRGMERRGYSIHWLDGVKPMETLVNEIITINSTTESEN